jgi:uncharacterized protein
MSLTLSEISGKYWIHQFDELSESTYIALEKSEAFWTLCKSANEVSVVTTVDLCSTADKSEGPWSLFMVDGVLDFSLTGILHSLTKPLAEKQISVFAISTFDTDYLLVRSENASKAKTAWQEAGIGVS